MDKFYKTVFLSLMLCLSPFAVKAKLFDAQTFTLSNGMNVYVIENHKAPIIKHMLWFKAGAVDEQEGKGGSAHLLEHLMFRGTSQISGAEFEKVLQENGVDSNAFTAKDYTAYHHNLDVSKLELVMALEADRFQNLKISDTDFETEKKIVYQERKQVVENNPSAPFFENYQNLLWQEHPYHRPVSGTASEILSLQKQDVEDFYNKYYTPKNAILVLSGDIDAKTAQKLAEKYYGNIEKEGVSSILSFPKLKTQQKTEFKMNLPQINAERYVRTYIAPSYNFSKEDMYSLILFSKYLGEGETSVLYKDLVLNKKLALAVSSSYDYANRSYGEFSISAIPADGVEISELVKAMDEAIEKAIADLNIDKLNNTKDKILASLIYVKDNPFKTAQIFGMMKTVGMSFEDIENYADNISMVKYTDVKSAAKNLINNTASVSGVLSPIGENK